MASLRRAALLLLAGAAFFTGPGLGEAAPAQANVICDAGGTVAGGVGFGSPLGDACNAVADAGGDIAGAALDPLKEAAGALGNGIFEQISGWVADGATWLLGEVVALTDETTTPHLLSNGFVKQYRQMALIATMLAAFALLVAVLDALSRGDLGLLARALLVNLPLAAIATSAAYIVVQLLIGATDGLCHMVTASARGDVREFFKGAIEGLGHLGAQAGSEAEKASGVSTPGAGVGGAAPGAAVPVFVGLIAAAVAAFAAFFVWIELLMRDAAVYVVALFFPFALAAWVSPRWSSALRRTAELLVVVVFSKFVIVVIIALAASVLAEGGGVEQVLAAGALLLLACFSPLVLLRWIPVAEGAVATAYGRQSAAGASVSGVHLTHSAAMMRRSLQGHEAKGGVLTIPAREGGASSSGSRSTGVSPAPVPGRGSKAGTAGTAGAEKAGGAAATGDTAAAGAVTAAAKVPLAAAEGARGAAGQLGQTAAAQGAGEEAPAPPQAATGAAAPATPPANRPSGAAPTPPGGGTGEAPRPASPEQPRPPAPAAAEPSEADGGEAPTPGTQPQRPPAEQLRLGKDHEGEK
jgi:hypothetical protein